MSFGLGIIFFGGVGYFGLKDIRSWVDFWLRCFLYYNDIFLSFSCSFWCIGWIGGSFGGFGCLRLGLNVSDGYGWVLLEGDKRVW